MANSEDERPVIDVVALRSDIYQLVVLLFADRDMADRDTVEADVIRELAEDYYEGAVNRWLVWVAISSRQLLDIKDSAAGARRCGRFCPDYPPDPDRAEAWKDLTSWVTG